jgi:hypothetical protein
LKKEYPVQSYSYASSTTREEYQYSRATARDKKIPNGIPFKTGDDWLIELLTASGLTPDEKGGQGGD